MEGNLNFAITDPDMHNDDERQIPTIDHQLADAIKKLTSKISIGSESQNSRRRRRRT